MKLVNSNKWLFPWYLAQVPFSGYLLGVISRKKAGYLWFISTIFYPSGFLPNLTVCSSNKTAFSCSRGCLWQSSSCVNNTSVTGTFSEYGRIYMWPKGSLFLISPPYLAYFHQRVPNLLRKKPFLWTPAFWFGVTKRKCAWPDPSAQASCAFVEDHIAPVHAAILARGWQPWWQTGPISHPLSHLNIPIWTNLKRALRQILTTPRIKHFIKSPRTVLIRFQKTF